MSQLHLPEGAEAAVRLVVTNAFERSFAINLYGAGRRGWFVASLRFRANGRTPQDRDVGPEKLPKGEWRTLLHLIDRNHFWQLPLDGSHLADPSVTVEDGVGYEIEDGEWIDVSARMDSRYHRIKRFIWREPGLDQIVQFCGRVSGFFPARLDHKLADRPVSSEPTGDPD